MQEETLEAIEARAAALVEDHRQLLEALVTIRQIRELNQSELGERMGVSQSAVSQFERYDANPRLSTLRRYALAVGARLETRVVDDIHYVPARPDVRLMQPIQTRPVTAETPINWGSSPSQARVVQHV
jgi:transcriptional regulator with XRE-family HTH domain